MAISEATIKQLWGAAAGRCAYPGCQVECLSFLGTNAPVVIGEMAHVIAKSTGGPRGGKVAGSDEYPNLVLLCPTHHTLVDKAPEGQFPVEELHRWKQVHEENVRRSLQSPHFDDRASLDAYVKPFLLENHACWRTYGPEGTVADRNANSSTGLVWPYRKLALIIPNNRRIINAVIGARHLLTTEEYLIFCEFQEHAEGFELAAREPIEDIPRFPQPFGEIFGD
jgi:hypothetical protein